MIIVKTEEFNRQVLYDLAYLAIFKKEYLNSIKNWDSQGKLLKIGYRNQPSKTLKFIGSYTEKKLGSYVSDIDTILLLDKINDPRFFLRIKDILKNIDKTPFKFVRFYCGYVKGLEPAWKIGEKGQCDFDLKKVNEWLENLQKNYPEIYEKIKPYLEKDTISVMDVLKANSILEPYISLNWTKDEIINGYKIYNSVKYDFEEMFITYKRYRVIKFIYKYKDSYCFIDVNIKSNDLSSSTNDDYQNYYTNNKHELYKSLKRKIYESKSADYLEDRKNTIGHITPLAAFSDFIGRMKKYKIIPPEKIEEMEVYARKYAEENNIPTIDYDELKKIIAEKVTPLYEKYKEFIQDKYKEDIFVLEIRTLQINQQVPKSIIEKRQRSGYDCTLFPMNVKHIKFIYKKAKDSLLDPFKVYDCVFKSCENTLLSLPWLLDNIFIAKKYKIIKEDDNYSLYLDDKKIETSTDLKKLQLICLTGTTEFRKPYMWYVQWNKAFTKYVEDKRGEKENISLIYNRGNAIMKITPRIKDRVLVLSEKNIIYEGFVISEHENGYGMFLKKKDPPIYIGKSFRRNWNLVKQN